MSFETKKKTEDMRAYHREWSRKNKDRLKAKREQRKDIIRAQRKANREANIKKIRAHQAAWQKKNGHRNAAYYRKYRLKVEYGLTPLRYERLLAVQGRMCLICDEPHSERDKLAVDHDHATGQIRGLICRRCNAGIGLFRDSRNFLRRAAAYLKNPPMSRGYRSVA
jgi:hypothetical protein